MQQKCDSQWKGKLLLIFFFFFVLLRSFVTFYSAARICRRAQAHKGWHSRAGSKSELGLGEQVDETRKKNRNVFFSFCRGINHNLSPNLCVMEVYVPRPGFMHASEQVGRVGGSAPRGSGGQWGRSAEHWRAWSTNITFWKQNTCAIAYITFSRKGCAILMCLLPFFC